jgi:hypothetical protein
MVYCDTSVTRTLNYLTLIRLRYLKNFKENFFWNLTAP